MDQLATTTHSIKIGKKELHYSVTCGTVVLREEAEKDGNRDGNKAKAELFFIAYTLLDGKGAKAGAAHAANPAKRPVTFSFNGGPGSSSVWMHLGLLGPKRVQTDEFGHTPPPPYALVDNDFTLLADSDLVFIDPIGTGFSRMADGEKVKEFHDYQRDLDSVGEFIRSYLSKNHRWTSPKYIIGESYGTTRAAGLSAHLQEHFQINLNGLMLISCAIDFSTIRFDAGNDLPFVLFLPTYTAAAWHHKKLAPTLQKKSLEDAISAAKEFAQGEYARLLFQGSRLNAAQTKAAVAQLAGFTGLSAAYLERANLRVSAHRFFKELLRDEGKVIGRFDARFTGQDRDDAGESLEADPSHTNLDGAYGAHINHYLRHDLQFASDAHYTLLGRLYLNWKWQGFEGRYPNSGEALRKAMHANPHMRVYVASGYFDLATPFFATDYTLNHAITRPEMHERIQTEYFGAGHMMYINRPDLKRLATNLAAFVRN